MTVNGQLVEGRSERYSLGSRLIAAGLLASAALSAASWSVVIAREGVEAYDDHMHRPSGQEQFISERLGEAFDKAPNIRCLSPAAMAARSLLALKKPTDARQAYTVEAGQTIFIKEAVCEAVAEVAEMAVDKTELIDEQLLSIMVVTHEYSHFEGNESEAEAQRFVVQNTDTFAEALGVDGTLLHGISNGATALVHELDCTGVPGYGQLPAEYRITPGC